jgi:hypothetical protein
MLSLTMKATSRGAADRQQRLGEARRLVLVDALHAELERGHRPGVERALEPLRESRRTSSGEIR